MMKEFVTFMQRAVPASKKILFADQLTNLYFIMTIFVTKLMIDDIVTKKPRADAWPWLLGLGLGFGERVLLRCLGARAAATTTATTTAGGAAAAAAGDSGKKGGASPPPPPPTPKPALPPPIAKMTVRHATGLMS